MLCARATKSTRIAWHLRSASRYHIIPPFSSSYLRRGDVWARGWVLLLGIHSSLHLHVDCRGTRFLALPLAQCGMVMTCYSQTYYHYTMIKLNMLQSGVLLSPNTSSGTSHSASFRVSRLLKAEELASLRVQFKGVMVLIDVCKI